MVVICISLMISDVKHLFMGLLAICMSFFIFIFWEIAIQVLGSFCIRTIPFLKIVLLLTCGSFFLFWKLTPYQVYGLQIFPPIPGLALPLCGCFHLLCRSTFVCCSPSCQVLLLLPVLCACSPLMSGNFLLGKRKVISSTTGAGNIG